MKRLFAFMMVLAMVLSLGVTAFATEGSGKIQITNATINKQYTPYKIFDAALNTDQSGISYTITPGTALFTEMFGADGTKDNDFFTYTAGSNAVALKADVKNEDMFAYLEGLVGKMTPAAETVTATSTTVEFSGLDYGYYLITSTLGAIVTIDSTNPTAVVIDKNQKSGDLDKLVYDAEALNEDGTKGAWVEDNSVNVGDVIEFKIDFTATNYEGEKAVTHYTLKDTLTPAGWAAIDLNTIEITIGGKDAVKGTDWTLTSGDTNGFEIYFPWQETNDKGETSFKHAATVEVVVKYKATVLEAAAENDPAVKKNTATFDKDNKTTETRLYNLGYTKIDKATQELLEGAIFGLYSDAECKTPVKVKATSTAGVYVFDKTATSNQVTGSQVVVMGLKAGTYYLKELVAPDGYNLMAEVNTVVVGDADSDQIKIGEVTYTVNNADLNIENSTGVELPSTGGEGTMKMITIGTIIAIGFAVLLITNKKMTIYQD